MFLKRTRTFKNARNRAATQVTLDALQELLWEAEDNLDTETAYARYSVPTTLPEVVHGHRHHELVTYARYGHSPLAHPITCQKCMFEFWVWYSDASPALKMPPDLLRPPVSPDYSPTQLFCPQCGEQEDLELSAVIIPTIVNTQWVFLKLQEGPAGAAAMPKGWMENPDPGMLVDSQALGSYSRHVEGN